MTPTEPSSTYYVHKIREGLAGRQRDNSSYSLRAYARDLEVHPATLSQVLQGKRPLPLKNSKVVAEKLKLGPKERALFFESFFRRKSALDEIKIDANDERFILDESHHRVIAEWEHYAVLTLLETKDFEDQNHEFSTQVVARRLGITETRAQVVVENLQTSGLITRSPSGKFVPTHDALRTTEDVSSHALRESHRETLDLGKRKLEDVDISLRDFSAITFAIDIAKVPDAKTIIREFRRKMAALVKEGNKTEVYQLAIQLFPLTQVSKNAEIESEHT